MSTNLSISNILNNSWKALTANFWVLVGIFIGYVILYAGITVFEQTLVLSGHFFLYSLVSIAALALSTLFMLGYWKNIFEALDGDEPQLTAYSQQARKFWKTLGASLLISIPVMIYTVIAFILALLLPGGLATGRFFITEGLLIGPRFGLYLIAFLLPLFYFAIRVQFFMLYIVDEDAGAFESLRKSWTLTKGNVGTLIFFIFIMMGIVILGIICLIVGVFIAIPFVSIIQCALFKAFKAQKAENVAVEQA